MTQIEEFQTKREVILKTLELFERNIANAIHALQPEARTPALVAAARQLTEEQTRLVHDIILTDQRITRAIENEQDRISLEMSASNRTLETVQRFKSSWVAGSGEGLDTSR